MAGQKIERKTPLRSLRPSVFRHITDLLDVNQMWKRLAMLIKRRNGTPMFDTLRIQILEQRAGSPSQGILDAWSNDNARVHQLLDLLVEAKLYQTANYLAVDVLEESPVCPEDSEAGIESFPHSVHTNVDSLNYAAAPDEETECKVPVENDSLTQLKTCVQAQAPVNDTIVKDLIFAHRNQREVDDCLREGAAFPAEGDGKLHQFSFDVVSAITDNFNPKPVSHGGKLLGSGGFGEVFLGVYKNAVLAVKKLKEDVTIESTKQFFTEIEVLSQIHHENLLPLVGYSSQDALICVVYPYMPNGSLEDRLARKDDTRPLPAALRVQIAKGVARGIDHLHTGGDKVFIHRDIKSANVLLDKDFTAKVGDCGLVHHGPSNNKTHTVATTVIGTNAYMAPEYFQGKVSVKLDTYSYGVVLLELLTGLPAYDESREETDLLSHMTENCEDIMDMIDSSAGEWAESVIRDIYETSQQCIEPSRKKRPTITDILPVINLWPET